MDEAGLYSLDRAVEKFVPATARDNGNHAVRAWLTEQLATGNLIAAARRNRLTGALAPINADAWRETVPVSVNGHFTRRSNGWIDFEQRSVYFYTEHLALFDLHIGAPDVGNHAGAPSARRARHRPSDAMRKAIQKHAAAGGDFSNIRDAYRKVLDSAGKSETALGWSEKTFYKIVGKLDLNG